ncbi:MAG: ferrous iron transport protein B, partial [Firmicutes bacterium]|nr:ferrous iron transport protein B [Bacillota bacterium]
AGNPNVGKTSLFNRITHSAEHVGNWHGVTVKANTKEFLYDHRRISLTDLPGIYSLTVYSKEEEITRDAVLGIRGQGLGVSVGADGNPPANEELGVRSEERRMDRSQLSGVSGQESEENRSAIPNSSFLIPNSFDAVVCVCEVNNLSRNLYFALQLLELDVPVLIAINMMDELKKRGRVLNYRHIERALKIPVVPLSAKYHSDVHLLTDVALDFIKQGQRNTARLSYLDALPVREFSSIIGSNAAKAGISARWAAIKCMENDALVLERLNLSKTQKAALAHFGDCQAEVARLRYEFIDGFMCGAISKNVASEHHEMHEHAEHGVPIEIEVGVRKEEVGSDDEKCRMKKGRRVVAGSRETEKNPSKLPTSYFLLPNSAKHKRLHDKHAADAARYTHGFSKLDRVVLNKYLAIPIFLLVMVAIFFLTFGVVGFWASEGLWWGIQNGVRSPLKSSLESINCPAWITALLADGVINGVGGILRFLPQVVLLFFFLAMLEDSGYLSRVAFMTDGLFRKLGLSGRSAFTLLMGFGCSATAVLTARGLEDEKTRRKTVLVTPFLSCSARLPVYAAVAGVFFTTAAGFSPLVIPLIIFALYVLGAAVSLTLAFILEKTKRFKSGKLSFIMEMPPYRVPTGERVWQIIWKNLKAFVVRVGTVVFALNVIVWLLANFSLLHGFVAGTEYRSILETFASFIAPVFAPLGFGDWKAVTALIGGLAAKEVVVSILLSFGGAEAVFTGEFAALAGLSFMVFTLLYVPCVAALASIKKETGFRWMLASLSLSLGVAYLFSLAFYWTGRLILAHAGLAVGVLIAAAVFLAVGIVIYRMLKKKSPCPYGCAGCDGECSDSEKRIK